MSRIYVFSKKYLFTNLQQSFSIKKSDSVLSLTALSLHQRAVRDNANTASTHRKRRLRAVGDSGNAELAVSLTTLMPTKC
jgi:hypothetical protein